MRTLAIFMLMVLFWPLSAQAKCTKESTVDELLEAMKQGEEAFAVMDSKTLLLYSGRAREQIVPCLREVLNPDQAASLHLLMALDAYFRHDSQRVKAELHAVRRLKPDYRIPPEVADGDHPLLKAFDDSARYNDGMPELAYAPSGGFALIDGIRNAPRMSQSPVLIQIYATQSTKTWLETKYVLPGEKLPNWDGTIVDERLRELGFDPQPTWQKPWVWYVAAGSTFALAATFYGVAVYERGKFDDRSTPEVDLNGHRDRAIGFGTTAAVLGGISLGLGATGIAFEFTFDDQGLISPITPITFAPDFHREPGIGHAYGQGAW